MRCSLRGQAGRCFGAVNRRHRARGLRRGRGDGRDGRRCASQRRARTCGRACEGRRAQCRAGALQPAAPSLAVGQAQPVRQVPVGRQSRPHPALERGFHQSEDAIIASGYPNRSHDLTPEQIGILNSHTPPRTPTRKPRDWFLPAIGRGALPNGRETMSQSTARPVNGPRVPACGSRHRLGGMGIGSVWRRLGAEQPPRADLRQVTPQIEIAPADAPRRPAISRSVSRSSTGDGCSWRRWRAAPGRRRRQSAFIAVKFGAHARIREVISSATTRGRPRRRTSSPTRSSASAPIMSISTCRRGSNPHVPIEDTIGAIADMVKAGFVRHIGLSEAGGADRSAGRRRCIRSRRCRSSTR